MADLEKTVAIVFNAVDNTGGALTSIGANMQGLAGGAQNVTGPLADMAAGVLKANAAIVALGVSMIGVAVNEAGKFEASINEIGTLFGGTRDQINAFGDQVLAYSGTSVKGIGDINGALYAAVSAGVDYTKSLDFMRVAEQLSVAGKADLSATTVALVSTLNAYGASTSEAARYSDVLFQTVRLGQTTLPELAGSLAQVTGIAAAAGIPFETLSAAVAALTAYGLPTTQAITGLKAAISNIIKPSSDAEKAASELGIQFDANTLQSKGFAGVLDDVYKATHGNVGEMTRFFGSVEGLNVALTLGSDKSSKFAGSLQGMATAGGATAQAFDTMSENADLMAQKLENVVLATLITAGRPLLDEWEKILTAVGNMFRGVKVEFDAGTFAPLFRSLEKLLADLGEYFQKIAGALPEALRLIDFSGLQRAFGDLGAAFSSIFDGVDLTTPEGLARAIQFVIDSIESLVEVGAGILTQWGEWSGEIAGVIESFNKLSTAQKQAIGEGLGMGQMLDILFGAVGKVGTGIEAMGFAFEAIATVQMAKFITGATSAKEAMALIQAASAGAGVALAGTALTGGLVAAAGAAGYGFGTLLNDGLTVVIDKLGGGKGGLGGLIYDLTHDTDALTKSTTAAAPAVAAVGEAAGKLGAKTDAASRGTYTLSSAFASVEEQAAHLADLYRLGSNALGDWADKQVAAASKADFLATAANALAVATGKVKEETQIAADGLGGFSAAASKSGGAMAQAAKDYLDAARAAGTLDEAHKEVRAAYDRIYDAQNKAVGGTRDYKTALEVAGDAAKNSAKDTLAVAKAAADYQTTMHKIDADLQGKLIESRVKLDIAEVESNAKVASEIISGISQTYQADVGLVGDLMSQVQGGYSTADKVRIAMAREADGRVSELHTAQMALIAAQVDYISAKTAAAAAGNPLVTIQADGLKPHLEAFMWEILGAIQVKMATEGGDHLVGGCTL